jgi:CDP-diacylglycerol--serine O-phosphatidyltransferase
MVCERKPEKGSDPGSLYLFIRTRIAQSGGPPEWPRYPAWIMKQLPNIFTLLNLAFGCLATIFILQNGIAIWNGEDGNQLVSVPEKIWLSSLFIGLAAAADFLDGFLARLLKVNSPLGKQLDSLSDVVSFGVAPGLIFYQFLRISLMRQEDGIDASVLWLMPSLLVPCAAAIRLARFNLDQAQKFEFRGIPTPAVGLLVATLPLIYWHSNSQALLSILLNRWALYGLIVLLCAGMVSKIPMLALKFTDLTWGSIWPMITLLVLGVLAFSLFQWLGAPILFLLYIVLSLISKKKPNDLHRAGKSDAPG